MKKFLAVFLAIVMILSFAGCSSNDSSDKDVKSTKKEKTTTELFDDDDDSTVNQDRDLGEEIDVSINPDTKVGDCIAFGKYEQDNYADNGKESIEWIVLEVNDNKALIVSKYALDCKQYNPTWTEDCTWETCSLRNWLNDEFFNTAFNGVEKSMIPTVTVSADKNPTYDWDPGNETQDQIFLLSIAEVDKYFSSDSERECKPTKYAVANGDEYTIESNGNCYWWLRTPGMNLHSAAVVDYNGTVRAGGDSVVGSGYAIRPAMWIIIGI